jgi:hypothetical protein
MRKIVHRTRRFAVLACCLTLFLFATSVSKAGMPGVPEPDNGWISLFDGTSLDGWKQHNGQAKYEVKNDAIVGTAVKEGPNSFLCTKQMYGDFVLEFQVKVDKGLNSGVQIRSNTSQQKKAVNGPQVEIEAAPGESGYIYGESTGRGWLSPDRSIKDAFNNGEWNQYRVKATGSRIQTWVNGQKIADLRDQKASRRGFIGLQVHSVGADGAGLQVRWRNIRLKPLDRGRWSNLFNGRTGTGWRNPYDHGKAEVVNGEIHLTAQNGKFFIATEKKYDDFILETSVQVPDRKANSGIQFRSHVEPNKVYGYQAEVDPSDRSWSGGVYDANRRGWIHNLKNKSHAQSAFEPTGWNRYRIHVNGDHIRVYVNGLKTADFTDEKDDTGYIALQHHGEKGKTYKFRNIRISNLEK